MAEPVAETFGGWESLADLMERHIQRAVQTGQVGSQSVTDANGVTRQYRDIYELIRARDLLRSKATTESGGAYQRRLIALVSPR